MGLDWSVFHESPVPSIMTSADESSAQPSAHSLGQEDPWAAAASTSADAQKVVDWMWYGLTHVYPNSVREMLRTRLNDHASGRQQRGDPPQRRDPQPQANMWQQNWQTPSYSHQGRGHAAPWRSQSQHDAAPWGSESQSSLPPSEPIVVTTFTSEEALVDDWAHDGHGLDWAVLDAIGDGAAIFKWNYFGNLRRGELRCATCGLITCSSIIPGRDCKLVINALKDLG